MSSLHGRDEDLIVQSSDMALINIASLANSGALDLSPRFQRRNRWKDSQKSQLIESFLLNVPVPPVYLAEEARGVFAVIDGKQRLTAISEFLNDKFRLTQLSFRPELEGRTYSELGAELASLLSMRPLRAVMVMRQTADWVKHEVFLRLNTGGQPLNAQEIRNVAFAGPLNDRIISLAEAPFLRNQLKVVDERSSAYADMTDVELVVRFFALAESWQHFGGSLRGALDRFMLTHHQDGPAAIEVFSGRFIRALDWCERIWGSTAFRRFDGAWRDQMIGGVYDAQMVAVDLASDEMLRAVAALDGVAVKAMEDLFEDHEFDASVRLSTNTSARVLYRIRAVQQLLSRLARA